MTLGCGRTPLERLLARYDGKLEDGGRDLSKVHINGGVP